MFHVFFALLVAIFIICESKTLWQVKRTKTTGEGEDDRCSTPNDVLELLP